VDRGLPQAPYIVDVVLFFGINTVDSSETRDRVDILWTALNINDVVIYSYLYREELLYLAMYMSARYTWRSCDGFTWEVSNHRETALTRVEDSGAATVHDIHH
jgi:hypothetical protein